MSRSILLYAALVAAAAPVRPVPPGRLVDLGGHRLHVHCRGAGQPVVVIGNGFDEFSSDWSLGTSKRRRWWPRRSRAW